MVATMFLAYFEDVDNAKEAMHTLRDKGYTVSLDEIDTDLPDPDLSVSALMVGFLPDLAHGIFGTDNAKELNKEGAFLLIIVDNQHKKDEVQRVVDEFGGTQVEYRDN